MESQRPNLFNKHSLDNPSNQKKGKSAKRRRIDWDNKAYSPHGNTRPGAGRHNPLHLRIIGIGREEEGDVIPILNLARIKGVNKIQLAEALKKVFLVMLNGKSIEVRILNRSKTGSPTRILVNGEEFNRFKNFRVISFFSKKRPIAVENPITKLPKTNPLFESGGPFELTKPNDSAIKAQHFHCTEEGLAAAAREKRNIKHRAKPQDEIMALNKKNKISATKYAQATKYFLDKTLFDNCHMIPHHCNKPFHPLNLSVANLFIASYHLNTDMFFIEKNYKKFAKALKKRGCDINVFAHMVAGEEDKYTQLAHTVDIIISDDEKEIHFTLDAQTEIEPSLEQEKYVDALVESILLVSKKELQEVENIEEDEEKIIEPKQEDKAEENYRIFETPNRGRTLVNPRRIDENGEPKPPPVYRLFP